eukprot:TRINITY_DN668_c0_g2_i1.p1 TRINITY_DN668_c0_g2~~TRINITY_DN668_c0_g2_i1.p1  ORF type:complete len:463 (+),score=132.97 TRINITY_DN668_c0_g2_i1:16-1404(+)
MPKNKRNRHRAKRQWRGIDTTDIEDENLRQQQELLAGGPLNKRKTEDLAYVDKGGKSNIQLSADERKRRAQEKVLTVDKMIQPNPHTKPLKVGPGPKAKPTKKRKAPTASSAADSTAPSDEFFDLWGDAIGSPSSSSSAKQPVASTSSADSEADADTPAPKRAKRNTAKPSSVPAVEVAQPGASYHPAPDDHQELLAQAIAFRLRQQDAEKKRQRALRRGAVLRMTADGIGGDAPQVNTDDMSDEEDEDGQDKPQTTDDDAMDAESEHVNQPWTGEKTKQERNRELRRKAHELKVIEAKQKKQFKQQLEKLPEIIKEIEDKEAEQKQRQQIKSIKMSSEPADIKPKKLGPYKYEEPEPDYLLSEQLPESLRTLNNANKFSLLRDRFQSLQKRNIIEPRVKQRRVYRYHKKRVEKFSTRDPLEQPQQQQQQQQHAHMIEGPAEMGSEDEGMFGGPQSPAPDGI